MWGRIGVGAERSGRNSGQNGCGAGWFWGLGGAYCRVFVGDFLLLRTHGIRYLRVEFGWGWVGRVGELGLFLKSSFWLLAIGC